ncbi:unnamed protein product [Somion occarium]|uniref:HhH-GPD domain-containing protein n=1 Tax=Somion occarium TaxID=3059160 RepID=A0ABP1DH21_9APHY
MLALFHRVSYFPRVLHSSFVFRNMPITRSASRNNTVNMTDVVDNPPEVATKKTNGTKRKAANGGGRTSKKKAKAEVKEEESEESEDVNIDLPPPSVPLDDPSRSLVPAELTFSFDDAKKHLISVDARFKILFDRLGCGPFEHLQQFDPFSTLAVSILGQQISWKAARAIQHRFIRLFNPGLPEKATVPYDKDAYFPTAKQVAETDATTLRSAGLSERKASYILDLAQRFADGRLSTEKLLQADDDELYGLLTDVRGIGPWTVDMFAIFSLRRPDILPTGDLGVQRGVTRWFLAMHEPSFNISISPDKLPGCPNEQDSTQGTDVKAAAPASGSAGESDASVILPAAAIPSTPQARGSNAPPPPVTPSVNKAVSHTITMPGEDVIPLPYGITSNTLKARLNAKQRGKSQLLSPTEMGEFTHPWKPYRSLGVYYMWAVAEGNSA